jgi:hypothetical protein
MGDWRQSLALDGAKWLASSLCPFTPWETATSTHFIGGWVGPTADLDVIERRKIYCLYKDPSDSLDIRLWLVAMPIELFHMKIYMRFYADLNHKS